MTSYPTPYRIDTLVPHLGRVKAIKKGEMEWEYLLTKAGTVTWVSHSDIEAMIEANKDEK